VPADGWAIAEAVGVWAGAVATTATAIIAVSIANKGASAERRRAQAQQDAARRSAAAALAHAIEVIEMITAEPVPSTQIPINRAKAMIASAQADVGYALGLPFLDRYVLNTALNLKIILHAMLGELDGAPAGWEDYPAARLAAICKFNATNFDDAKSSLRDILGDA
jgi:NADH:ubiquinone oxidoreductase subunit 6 (subunit J)